MREGYKGKLTRPEIRQEQNRLYHACDHTGNRVRALYKITFLGEGRDHEYEDAKEAWEQAKTEYQRFVETYVIVRKESK